MQQSQIQLNIFNLPIVRLFIYNKYIFTEDRINYLLKKDITITMNLYEILHVAEDAPEEIIKLAYKGLVQKYHPDRYKANDANQKMVAIRNAYEVLIDPIQRKAYDEKLKKNREQFNVKQKLDIEYPYNKQDDFINSPEYKAKKEILTKKKKKKRLIYFGCILLIIVIAIPFIMQPKPAEESYFNEVEISTIDGVSLGMSPVEVTLLKGQAENSSEKINKIHDDLYHLRWNYDFINIDFIGPNENDLKTSRVCGTPIHASINNIVGISTEKEVNLFFGKPDHISIHKDGLSKWISYEKYNAAFEVEKENIIYSCLDEDYIAYEEEYKGV